MTRHDSRSVAPGASGLGYDGRLRGVSDDKRMRILAAARELLAERLYEQASVAEIAQRAGVAKGTVYLYFPSKAALVNALTVQIREAVNAAAARASDSSMNLTDRLTALARSGIGVAVEYRDIIRYVDLDVLVSARPGERERSAGSVERAMIEEAVARGEIAAEVDPKFAAMFLDAVLRVLVMSALDEEHDEATLRQVVDQTVDFVIRGLGGRPRRTQGR
ncbi:MAG: TetR/AcrR family transcriptional regulator [Nocardioides sp.]